MRKTYWWGGTAAILILAGGTWWWMKREPEIRWRLGAVERGPVQVSVTATGALQAVTTVAVGTQVSGTVSALYADFNSRVKKGQVIARIDTTLLFAALMDAQSNLAKATAQDYQAQAELRRTRALSERELVSQAELDAAEAAAKVAAANLASARAGVERARINLRYATILSPIDGIVLSRAVDIGQTVAASFNTPTLFSIAGDLREMQVLASVDEADIGKIRAGQGVSFTVDAYPDTLFQGEVEQVRLQPIVTQNVVTYNVMIRVRNPDLKLMPGMTASLTIIVERKEDVLLAPAAALRFQPPMTAVKRKARADASGGERPGRGRDHPRGAGESGSRGRLFVLENGALKPVWVGTGLSDGARTEIAGPLEAGDSVVISMTTATAAAPSTARPFGMGGRGRGIH